MTNATELLAPDTTMGAVTLRVGDLDRMIAYYRDAVTLDVISEQGGIAVLGRGGVPALVLQHAPELRNPEPRSAGLFHTAVLFDTQEDLAAAVYSVATRFPNSFTGSSDHLVSKAFYFTDPEGNGVELYWDRDRTEWSWAHGQIEMSTLYLDPNAFLREHLTEETVDGPRTGGATIGHVHLSVGDVTTAHDFYVGTLGFEVTSAFGSSALFVSAGGYHHHMAMNVWNSRGAGRRQPTLGLGQVEIVLPDADGLAATDARLRHHGLQTADDGRTVTVSDPWNNTLVLRAATTP
jgi:catechol 2,3-dioxygenase